ncbi:SIMPL domain-containing protein [Patescibacteria group bacterium]|nr:SIMPL domain-containing protein [Patescibacteria group bacterium]
MPPTQHIAITIPWYVPVILGASLVIAALAGSYTFYAVRAMDNVLTVTGSAKTRVTANSAKWTLTATRTVGQSGIAQGYAQIARDTEAVTSFLTSNGVSTDSITTQPAMLEEVYKTDSSLPKEYNIRQTVVVQSTEVDTLDALSKRIVELSNKGILMTGNWIEFYVSNLPELRVSLLTEAITDARNRAENIAKSGGQSVGSLKSASSGVVQVLAPNSIDVSDYGQYDTQSKEKEVMVTARATFFVR